MGRGRRIRIEVGRKTFVGLCKLDMWTLLGDDMLWFGWAGNSIELYEAIMLSGFAKLLDERTGYALGGTKTRTIKVGGFPTPPARFVINQEDNART